MLPYDRVIHFGIKIYEKMKRKKTVEEKQITKGYLPNPGMRMLHARQTEATSMGK